jgi:hypothetical protein
MRSVFVNSRFIAGFAVVLALAACADRARADLTFYNSLPTFTGANPGLPTETFESANVAAGSFVTFPGPVNSQTSNAAFAAGAVLPGFSIASVGSDLNTSLVATGTGNTTGGSKAVGITSTTNTMEITFGPAISAIGANLILTQGPGAAVSGTVNVQIFGSSGLLGNETVSASGVNTFFGISSNAGAITKIDITNSGTAADVFVDNLIFGTPTNVVNFSSRSAFVAANPGRSVETFESANVAPGNFVSLAGPINSQTGNAAFQPGNLLPGFTINSSSPLLVTGTGTTPGGTKEVGTTGTMQIIFSIAETAVGMDLVTSTGPGNLGSAIFDISVFGPGGLIETEQVSVSGLNTFFGVSAPGGITEIDITEEGSNSAVFIDNLTLTPTGVPEPSTFVLSFLGAATILGYGKIRRSKLARLG